MSRNYRRLADKISKQIMSHFIKVFKSGKLDLDDIKVSTMLQQEIKEYIYEQINDPNDIEKEYIGYFDGSAIPNPGQMQCGYIIIDPDTDKYIYRGAKRLGHGTNNIAEYSGLIKLLEVALDEEVSRLLVKGDSQLIIKQMNKEYQVKNEELKKYWSKAQALSLLFQEIKFEHVPRKQNKYADQLSRI